MPTRFHISATVPEAGSLSPEVNLHGKALVGIIVPSTWDAADITFQAASVGGGTYNNVYDDDDNEVTVQAAASRHILFDEDMTSRFRGANWIKVRSGTAGSPVSQTTAETVTLILV